MWQCTMLTTSIAVRHVTLTMKPALSTKHPTLLQLAQEVRQLGSERQRVQELRLRLSQEADLMEREKVAWATRKVGASGS